MTSTSADKTRRVLGVVLGALVVVSVSGGGWLWRSYTGAVLAQKRLEAKVRELQVAVDVEPFPSEANAAAIQVEAEAAERALAAVREGLRARGGRVEAVRGAPVPKTSTDAFFDIATFVERWRERARADGIALVEDERFAFASHAHSGPEPALIARVFRQRQTVAYLLELLFAAQPRALLGVRREAPTAVSGGPLGADFFVMDPRLSARLPGLVEVEAYRVMFEGRTDTLRALLNALGRFELPLMVRAVEVEPAPVDGAITAEEARPLIGSAWSRFTVTIEWVELVEAPMARNS